MIFMASASEGPRALSGERIGAEKGAKKSELRVSEFPGMKRLPSRNLTYPTWGKGKSSSNMH